MTDVIDRFNDKYTPEPNSGCWLWTGSLSNKGYGLFYLNGKSCRAHRVSWEIFKTPIPAGMLVCHTCDNPPCVNPDHLYVGTPRDNTQDMLRRGRMASTSGEQHGNSKLTELDVMAIRADPRTQEEIAFDFGITDGHVSKIKLRAAWGHLPAPTEKS